MSFKWYFKLTGVVAVGALLALAEVQAQQPTISDGLTKSIQAGNKPKTASLPAALFLPNANQQTLLMPNDGTDERLSDENTARVIAVCGRQIEASDGSLSITAVPTSPHAAMGRTSSASTRY